MDELVRDVPAHAAALEVATIAGRIEGDEAAQGVTIVFEDPPIAAAALRPGFGVATGRTVVQA